MSRVKTSARGLVLPWSSPPENGHLRKNKIILPHIHNLLWCLDPLVFLLPNYLAFKYFDFDRTLWGLMEKLIVCTKVDIYVFFATRNIFIRSLNLFRSEQLLLKHCITCDVYNNHNNVISFPWQPSWTPS